MVDIFPGISAFNGMLGAAKALNDINDAVICNQASIELQGQIIAAQEVYATLLQTKRELGEKVASFESGMLRSSAMNCSRGHRARTSTC